ncbi:MAG: hypothetical protein ABJE66_13500 [Deltaproteobacteria bacterium]
MRALAFLALVACKHPGGLGKTGEPFGLFASLQMGMTVDAVRKLAPDLRPDPKDETHLAADASDGFRYDVYFVDGHVAKFEIQPPTRVTRDELERAWGAPREVPSDLGIVYTNASNTLRVESSNGNSVDLTYLPMVPAENLLGNDTFDGVKLIGRPVADVKRDFAGKPHLQNEQWNANDYSANINNIFPATELWRDTVLDIRSGDDAIVNRWALIATFDSDPAGLARLNALFEKLWGKPTKDGDNLLFGADPVIIVERTGTQIERVHAESKQLRERK